MNLGKVSIGKRLAFSFVLMIMIVFLTNAWNAIGILNIRNSFNQVYEAGKTQIALGDRQVEHLNWVLNLQNHLITESLAEFNLELDPTKCALGQWMVSDEFQGMIDSSPALKKIFDQIKKPHEELHSSAITIHEQLSRGQTNRALQTYNSITEHKLNETISLLEQGKFELDKIASELDQQMHERIAKVFNQTYITLALAIIVGSLIGFVITRGITRPLRILQEAVAKIGDGDLGATWEIKSQDEIGQLSNTLAQTVSQLQGLMKNITSTSETLNALSENLSSSAVQTSAAITEVASTANEFAGVSVTTAENATNMQTNTDHAISELDKAFGLLDASVQDVSSAKNDVQTLTHAVSSLGEHSKKIGNIVEIISEISDQTNLLALNAAIEAARAGESGRGFAVVAVEVRELAEQSLSASSEIAELIRQILQDTDETINYMNRAEVSVDNVDKQIELTNEAFRQIGAFFSTIAGQVHNFADAANDLGIGSEEIAASTEEQSAMANEIEVDAEVLADLATKLKSQVASFRGF